MAKRNADQVIEMLRAALSAIVDDDDNAIAADASSLPTPLRRAALRALDVVADYTEGVQTNG